jgi:ABC-2 type transport system ATP-binding protein
MAEFAVECHALVKTYPGRTPVQAVRGIDLQVRQGECFGVLGPNGAGKTTTIEILEGLLTATSGTARVMGWEWGRDDQRIRQIIGVSLQETELSDKLTVRETLSLFRSFYPRGLSVSEAIAKVSLQEKENTWIKKLSGGQKQRLAVATALVGDPQVIFLDEPTTGLDPVSRRQLWEIIQSLVAAGRTVLLTTHYMDEAERLCDRVAIFDQGRVIAEGSPAELIRSLGAEHRVEIECQGSWTPPASEALKSLPGVQLLNVAHNRAAISVEEPHRVLPALVTALTKAGVALNNLTTRNTSLEDLFVQLTGRQLSGAAEQSEPHSAETREPVGRNS